MSRKQTQTKSHTEMADIAAVNTPAQQLSSSNESHGAVPTQEGPAMTSCSPPRSESVGASYPEEAP